MPDTLTLDTARPDSSVPDHAGPAADVPEPGVLAAQSWEAHHRRDWTAALQLWRTFRAAYPDHPAGYSGGVATLRHSGDPGAAETLSRAALARFPDDLGVGVEHAWNATERFDDDEAIARWQRVRARFPDQWISYLGEALAQRHAGRHDDVDILLRAAIPRFPAERALRAEYARSAAERQDWPEAAQRWAAFRQQFPDALEGYLNSVAALRGAGAAQDAEALLSLAVSRFPDEPAPAIEHAWLAHRRSDWPEALRRWEHVRARFPDEAAGYTAAAMVLREQRRDREAEALLLDAAQRFPNDPGPAIDVAWLKTHRRAWHEAEQLWSAARERFPDHLACYIGGALALRELHRFDEAEALLSTALLRAPDDPGLLSDLAWLAQIRRDWPVAVRRWAILRERNPGAIHADIQAARALCELWRHDEAEALLADSMRRFPDQAEPAAQFAWIAYQQRRQDDAAARFATLRARFPECEEGWVGGGLVLRDQFRLAEAAALLGEGMRRCPNNPRILLDYAQLPIAPIRGEDKDWPETLRRMERLRADFPAFELGYTFGIRLLQSARQPEAAEQLAGEASTRFPGNSEFAVEHARAAEGRSDWAEAIRRYTSLRERFPYDAGGDVGLARALAASGKHDEAETALRAAMQRFPGNSSPFAAYAQLAADRRDWPEALRRWTEAQRRFPDHKEFAHRSHDAQNRVAEMEPEGGRPLEAHERASLALGQAAKPDPATIDQQVSELVTQFESLGGRDLGCEFGIFQRDCGAEPLGLLRWADMTYDKLVETLESRFDGVGTPEFTELFTNAIGGGRPEYCTVDRRGMMFMRAFIYEDEMSFDKMYAAACRRLQFLTRKLIDDLEHGTKIFVFRVTDRNLTAEEIDALHAAMRRYGDNMLLYARYEDSAHPNGTVELVKPGLMIGYMDRFKASPTKEIAASPPTASWLAVCRAAYALWVGAPQSG